MSCASHVLTVGRITVRHAAAGAGRWLAQARARILAQELYQKSLEVEKQTALQQALDGERGSAAPVADRGLGTFSGGDHLRMVMNSRAVRVANIFASAASAKMKAEAEELRDRAQDTLATEEVEMADFDAAIADFDSALELLARDPDRTLADEIKAEREKAAMMRRAEDLAAQAAGTLALSDDFEGALKQLDEAVSLWPENTKIQQARQEALDKIEARDTFTQAMESPMEDLDATVALLQKAQSLDEGNVPIRESLMHWETRLGAEQLRKDGQELQEKEDYAAAAKQFTAAIGMLNGLGVVVDDSLEEAKVDCERKASAVEMVGFGDLFMEHDDFKSAVESYKGALKHWPENETIQPKLEAASEKQAAAEKAEAEKVAAEKLLAKLEELMAQALQQLADYELEDCVTVCRQALALDADQSFHARDRLELCVSEAETKIEAQELKAVGQRQLLVKDARCAVALQEAHNLDPTNGEIRALRDEAAAFVSEKQRLAAEAGVIERKHKAAAVARHKVKKAAKGAHWLQAAHHQAMELAKHLAAEEEKEKVQADPSHAAASAAAAAAEYAGPAGVSAARDAAKVAYAAALEGYVNPDAAARAAAVAGSAAASTVAGGLADAAKAAGQVAAVTLLDEEAKSKEAEQEVEWQAKKNSGMVETLNK